MANEELDGKEALEHLLGSKVAFELSVRDAIGIVRYCRSDGADRISEKLEQMGLKVTDTGLFIVGDDGFQEE